MTANVYTEKSYVVSTNEGSVPTSKVYVVLMPEFVPGDSLYVNRDSIGERFPTCLSFGSSGGPGFRTSVFELDSGYTSTNIEWDKIRARYDVTFDNATASDMQELERFFYVVRGSGLTFRYKDWTDYQVSKQILFVGDGETTEFQMFKRYTSGGHVFDRDITKLVPGTLVQMNIDTVIKTEGADFFVNANTGKISFSTPPGQGVIGEVEYAEFDVLVRFATDFLPLSFDDFDLVSVPTVPLIEVRS